MKAEHIRWFVQRPSDGEDQLVIPSTKWALLWKQQEGERYYRLELDGTIEFSGRVDQSSYELMREIDQVANRYEPRRIRLELFIRGSWTQVWEGRFTGNHFKEVDECACIYKLAPEVFDAYTCVIDTQDKELNVAKFGGKITARAALFSPYEFYVVRPASGSPPPEAGPAWSSFFTDTVLDDVRIFRREYRLTACVGGDPYPPPGSGWILDTNDCDTTGLAKYVRAAPITGDPPVIEAGTCLYDGDGGYVAFPPPPGVSLFVAYGYHSAPEIVGPTSLPFTQQFQVGSTDFVQSYKVKVPRGNVTYEWTCANPSVTIISGADQPTVWINVNMFYGMVTGFVLQCREVNPCGATGWASLVVDVRYGYGANATMPDIMEAPVECHHEGTFEVRLPVPMGGPVQYIDEQQRTYWQVTGPGQLIASTNTVATIRHNGGAGSIGVAYRYGRGFVANETPWSTPVSITPALSPSAEAIIGVPNMCAGTMATFRVPAHAGSSYDWVVGQELEILWGQGTNEIIVLASPDFIAGQYVFVRESPANSPQWVQLSECDGTNPPWFWAIGAVDFEEYEQSRLLRTVMETAFEPCGGLCSDFFQWSPINVGTLNYVTGEPNKLLNLVISNKGDIKYPTASEPARKSLTTLKKLITMVRYLFNTYWYHDPEADRYRIEHVKHFDDAEVIEFEEDACGKYSYEREQLPRSEKWIAMEAFNSDFIGLPVEHDLEGPAPRSKNPAVGDRSDEFTPGDVSTDLSYIQVAPDEDVSRKGFVILQCTAYDNGEGALFYDVELEPGRITNMAIPNGHLSWANLLYYYHRWGRPTSAGYMNNVWTEFMQSNRNKVGTTVKKMCAEDLVSFSPYKRYRTRHGIGIVQDALLNFHDDTITLKTEQQP